MAKEKLAEPSAPEQISVLKTLKQSSAAWLLGVNARTLRDRADLPRNADGSYNGRELFAAAEPVSKIPHLAEDDLEKVLLIADQLWYGGDNGPRAVAIFDCLCDLETRHGEGVYITVMREILRHWSDTVDITREEVDSPPSREEIKARVEEAIESEQRRQAFNNWKVVVRCDNCGKIRQGRRWTKTSPPKGYEVSGDVCPDCVGK